MAIWNVELVQEYFPVNTCAWEQQVWSKTKTQEEVETSWQNMKISTMGSKNDVPMAFFSN